MNKSSDRVDRVHRGGSRAANDGVEDLAVSLFQPLGILRSRAPHVAECVQRLWGDDAVELYLDHLVRRVRGHGAGLDHHALHAALALLEHHKFHRQRSGSATDWLVNRAMKADGRRIGSTPGREGKSAGFPSTPS
jgi:hypothetical protein